MKDGPCIKSPFPTLVVTDSPSDEQLKQGDKKVLKHLRVLWLSTSEVFKEHLFGEIVSNDEEPFLLYRTLKRAFWVIESFPNETNEHVKPQHGKWIILKTNIFGNIEATWQSQFPVNVSSSWIHQPLMRFVHHGDLFQFVTLVNRAQKRGKISCCFDSLPTTISFDEIDVEDRQLYESCAVRILSSENSLILAVFPVSQPLPSPSFVSRCLNLIRTQTSKAVQQLDAIVPGTLTLVVSYRQKLVDKIVIPVLSHLRTWTGLPSKEHLLESNE